MAAHTFDAVAFRALFPQFADPTKYPDAALSGYFVMATCNVEACDNSAISGDCLQLVLNLLTAHIAQLFNAIAQGGASGGTTGIQTGASVDKVSVTETPPPFTSAWQFWLSKTPYGQQALVILAGFAAGGFYFNGMAEGDAFRKVGGFF